MSKQVCYRQKYNGRRRILAAQDRENRFIVDYLQHKHPDIYGGVKKLYADFKTKYPAKHDVKKTKEYEEIITGAPAKKYKYTRHLTIKDNMLLTIELSDNPANIPVDATVNVAPPDAVPVDAPVNVAPPDAVPVDATVNVAPPDAVPVDATVNVAPPDAVPVDAPVNVAPPDAVPVDAPVNVAPPDAVPFDAVPFPDLTLPYMSDEIMGKLIEEMREDPTMACILDSMNDTFDDIFW